MANFAHFYCTSLFDELWISKTNILFSRKLYSSTWNKIKEFEAEIIEIDFSLDIPTIKAPLIAVLLRNGKIYISKDKGNSWTNFESKHTFQSIAFIKETCNDDGNFEIRKKYETFFALYENSFIDCFKIDDAIIPVYSKTINVKNVKRLYGRDESLFFYQRIENQYLLRLSYYNTIENLQHGMFSLPSKSVIGIADFDNFPAVLFQNGKVLFPSSNYYTNEISTIIENGKYGFYSAKKIKYILGCNFVTYVQLQNNSIFLGYKEIGWNKIWQPGDPIDNHSYEYDEITDIYLKCQNYFNK